MVKLFCQNLTTSLVWIICRSGKGGRKLFSTVWMRSFPSTVISQSSVTVGHLEVCLFMIIVLLMSPDILPPQKYTSPISFLSPSVRKPFRWTKQQKTNPTCRCCGTKKLITTKKTIRERAQAQGSFHCGIIVYLTLKSWEKDRKF